jgi:hypothetical protein
VCTCVCACVRCERLQDIELRGCEDLTDSAVLTSLCTLVSLRKLDLAGCIRLTSLGLFAVRPKQVREIK